MARIWVRLLTQAGFRVIYEPRGYVLTNDKRPDFIIILDDGTQLFVDIRTCDPQLNSHVDACCITPGFAAQQGVLEKERSWLELLKSQGDNFLAICHEHSGTISDGALALLDMAAGKFSPTSAGRAAFKAFWLSRLYITNSRGTADLINAKLPFLTNSHISTQATSSFIQHISPLTPTYIQLPSPIACN